ncbi:hypothetical protein C8R43DRAFT_957065 [Mycena crocata]|nr:hypothetical protein C8R43DRAFT_957065 [Mycena crocata]
MLVHEIEILLNLLAARNARSVRLTESKKNRSRYLHFFATVANTQLSLGGVGEAGEPGSDQGGRGGSGWGSEVRVEHLSQYDSIPGGTGGVGGPGGVIDSGPIGKDGGTGKCMQSLPRSSGSLVPPSKELAIAKFCEEYNVGKEIRNLLLEAGFKTAGDLSGTSDAYLSERRLKLGYIQEVKRALAEWNAT